MILAEIEVLYSHAKKFFHTLDASGSIFRMVPGTHPESKQDIFDGGTTETVILHLKLRAFRHHLNPHIKSLPKSEVLKTIQPEEEIRP